MKQRWHTGTQRRGAALVHTQRSEEPRLQFVRAPRRLSAVQPVQVGCSRRSGGTEPERRRGDTLFGGAVMTCTHKQKQQVPRGRWSSNRLQTRWEEAAASSRRRRPNSLFVSVHEALQWGNVLFTYSVWEKIFKVNVLYFS